MRCMRVLGELTKKMRSKGKVRSVDCEVIVKCTKVFDAKDYVRRKGLLVSTWNLHINFLIKITIKKGIVDVKLLDRPIVDERNSKVLGCLSKRCWFSFFVKGVDEVKRVEGLLVEGSEVDGEVCGVYGSCIVVLRGEVVLMDDSFGVVGGVVSGVSVVTLGDSVLGVGVEG
ncbi:hypothetical protein Tco_1432196 [Tanacetum coccineum]